MKYYFQLVGFGFIQLLNVCVIAVLIATGCDTKVETKEADPLQANINMYSHVWDEILNQRKIGVFNDNNFSPDIVLHTGATDIKGIDSVKNYYNNFLTGFSNIQFTVKDIFGQGDKLVKHWALEGTHTGIFFGIPATGNSVSIEGTTLVRMVNGKIAEERDFFDNLEFSRQLGLIPR